MREGFCDGQDRKPSVSAAGFAAFYAPAYCFTGANSASWPLFTYFPAVDQWNMFLVAGNEELGPPMWWYGWIASAALFGLFTAVIALLLPARATEKAWRTAFWSVPIAAFVFLFNWELVWFIQGWNPRWFEGGAAVTAPPGPGEPPAAAE
jgi:hypothetical protein